MRPVRLLLLLIAGLAVGYVSCFIFDLSHVDAQGVGLFTTSATGTRTNCAQLTGSVTGQTWCFEGSSNQVKVWNGTTFATVSLNNQVPLSFLIGSQVNTINDYFRYTPSGTNQQVGLFLDMTATNTLSSVGFFRIPFAIRSQTGGGTSADGVEGMNIVVQQNAADDVAFGNGLELAFNNLKRNDPLNPVDRNHYG